MNNNNRQSVNINNNITISTRVDGGVRRERYHRYRTTTATAAAAAVVILTRPGGLGGAIIIIGPTAMLCTEFHSLRVRCCPPRCDVADATAMIHRRRTRSP